MRIIFLLFFFLQATVGFNQEFVAKDIIAKSIKYHDPEGKLYNGDYVFHFEESRPDGKVSESKVRLAPTSNIYELQLTRNGAETFYSIRDGEVAFSLNGLTKISDADKEAYRINKERGIMMKNYYLYLWQLPMKLNDPGTIIHDNVQRTSFDDQPALGIKVTYEESVGKDIWYFYFHPLNHRLIGYRFYHDEAANDGEYILLEGEVAIDNIRIPKTRKWYTHKDEKYLGTDTLVNLETNQ